MANDSQKAARKFREFWLLAKDSEVGGYQKFWLSLISDDARLGLYAEATKATEETETTRRSLKSLSSLKSLKGGSNG